MAAPFDAVLAGMVVAGLGIEAICLFLSLTRDLLGDSLARLGLRTPHDRPLRKAGTRGWTVLDTMRLIAWRVAGIHPETIGARLGRSSNAVRAKARRLGIPAPPRKALRKVDPLTLADPQGSAGPVVVSLAAPIVRTFIGSPVTSAATPAAAPSVGSAMRVMPVADVGIAAAALAGDIGRQRELRLIRRVPTGAPLPAMTSSSPLAEPVATPAGIAGRSVHPARGELIIPNDPLADISWIANVKKVGSHETAVRALSMRYFGGQHYKAIAAEVGISLGRVRTILNRMQLPRDSDRRKFGPAWDRECALLTLERSDYVLQRDSSNADIEMTRRPLFWRRRRDGVRFTRDVRFKRGLLDEFDKYKGQTINVVTRADLDPPRLAFGGIDRCWAGAVGVRL